MANEIDQQYRVAHNDSRERDEADHRRGREGRLEQDVPDDNANQRQRHGRQDHQWEAEAFELGNDENVDAQKRDAKGGAHIPERDPRNLPFSVPQDRRGGFVERLTVKAHLRFGDRAPVGTVDERVDREHAIDWRFVGASQFGGDHFSVVAIAPEALVAA